MSDPAAAVADKISKSMNSEDRSILIVDDDVPFAQRLARAMMDRGFTVQTANSVLQALFCVSRRPPTFAVLDMRLQDGNGLDIVPELLRHRPDAHAIILTGYGNLATAVTAIKCGATDYLAKPADAEEILGALLATKGTCAPPPVNPMSPNQARWEHIQQVYELCGSNVSETARRLRMHRRTLQRILAKRPPR